MNRLFLLVLGLALLLVLSGCTQPMQDSDGAAPLATQPIDAETKAKMIKATCMATCLEMKYSTDLSDGPCIMDPMEDYPEWVCDVAHDPREAVDDIRENQCDAWHNKTAKHFVEVTPNCNFIKAV